MNLKEFRTKHPQYNDVNDEDLVRGMHKRFYSDIPFEQFAGSIEFNIIKPTPEPGLLKRMGDLLSTPAEGPGMDLTGFPSGLDPMSPTAMAPAPTLPQERKRGGVERSLAIKPTPEIDFSGGMGPGLDVMPEPPEGPGVTAGDKLQHAALRNLRGFGRMGLDMLQLIPVLGFELDKIMPPVTDIMPELGGGMGLAGAGLIPEEGADVPELRIPHTFSPEDLASIKDPGLRERIIKERDVRDTKFFQEISEWRQEFNRMTEGHPDLRDSFLYSVLPEGAGNLAGFILASILTGGGKPVIAGLAMVVEGMGAYNEALDATGDPDTALKALALGAPAGVLEVFGVSRIVNSLMRGMPPGGKMAMGRLIVQALKTGVIESAEELSQGAWGNVIANILYSDKSLLLGLKEAMGAGFILGTVAHVIAGMAGIKLRGGRLFDLEGQEISLEEKAAEEAVSPTGEITPTMELGEGLKAVREVDVSMERPTPEEALGKIKKAGEKVVRVTKTKEEQAAEILERLHKERVKEEAPAKIGEAEKPSWQQDLEKLAEKATESVPVSTEKKGIHEGERRFAPHETATSPEAIERMKQGDIVFLDTKTGKIRRDTSVAAIDAPTGKFEVKAWQNKKTGAVTVYGYGVGITPIQKKSVETRLRDILKQEKPLKREIEEKIPAKIAKAPNLVVGFKIGDKLYRGTAGENHGQLMERLDVPLFKGPKSGFIDTNTGEFLTRDEAERAAGIRVAEQLGEFGWKPTGKVEPLSYVSIAPREGASIEEATKRAKTLFKSSGVTEVRGRWQGKAEVGIHALTSEKIEDVEKAAREWLKEEGQEEVYFHEEVDSKRGLPKSQGQSIIYVFDEKLSKEDQAFVSETLEKNNITGSSYDPVKRALLLHHILKYQPNLLSWVRSIKNVTRELKKRFPEYPRVHVHKVWFHHHVFEREAAKIPGIKPYTTYSEAEQNTSKSKNLWVKLSSEPSNTGRTLLVQFSSLMLPSGEKLASAYYDRLYSGTREGFVRPADFWEIPEWIAVAANSLPNSDVYVVRNVKEAVSFLEKAGYETVAFSALDVNKPLIQGIAKQYKGKIAVGGYGSLKEFAGIPHITTLNSIEDLVEIQGGEFKEGADYRHFKGTKVIPRLSLSEGCLHKCAFCDVTPHGKVVERSGKDVAKQVEAIKALKPKLVYLNDKTFGQAKNYQDLPKIFKSLKSSIPGFRGFIVQTTASALNKLDGAWLKEAGVEYVELGVESYNDEILRGWNKPALTKQIDISTGIIRRSGLKFIPNILIGAKEETAQTYANTVHFLEENADIISHVNAYNLAIYEGTDLAKQLGEDLATFDIDENAIEKSWHKDEVNKKLHRDFATWLYNWSAKQLNKPLGGRPGVKETKIGEGELFRRLELFAPEKIKSVSVRQAVEKNLLTKDEGDFIEGVLGGFPQAWQEHFDVEISEQEFAPSAKQLEAYGIQEGAEGLRIEGVLLTERMKDVEEDAKHLAVMFKGSNVVTFIHELGEFISKRALNGADRLVVARLHTESGSKKSRNEWFSDEFEKWWLQDKPVSSKLLAIFHRILASIKSIYNRITAARVSPELRTLLRDVIANGREIKANYYFSNKEILAKYVLGAAPSQTVIESGGFSKNSKTGISWDPSTQCPKQEAFARFVEKTAPDFGLTVNELINVDVLADLYDLARQSGVDVPCSRCYVEGARRRALRAHEEGGSKSTVISTMAKQIFTTVPYGGQILRWSQEKIDTLNKSGGLRLFSFSDYVREYHRAEVDKLLRDAKKRGLSVKAITQNPQFVEDFGDTGILINVSIDSSAVGVDGMAWDEAAKWKKKYSNVKVRVVFGSIPELEKLDTLKHKGLDPFIDIFTPYHHEDKNQPLPPGAQDLSMAPVPTIAGRELIAYVNKKRPDLAKRMCCLVGAKCFSIAHDKQCAANCGLLAGNLSVPEPYTPAKIGKIEEMTTLLGWVKSMGGIWDPSLKGETAEFSQKESGIVGLVGKEGRPWDDLVDDAIASGWLREGDTADDLRELLRQDIRASREKATGRGLREVEAEREFEKTLAGKELPEEKKRFIPEEWREEGILVKKARLGEKQFHRKLRRVKRAAPSLPSKQELKEGFDKAMEEEDFRHGEMKQAALNDMADETGDLSMSFMGTGEIPRVMKSMVMDTLNYTGVKSRNPNRVGLNEKDIDWKNILRFIQMPDDLRRTFKQFDPVYQVQMARELAKVVLDNSFAEKTGPYFALKKKDRQKVDELLLEGERTLTEMFEEEDFVRLEATPKQIEGYTAIRSALNDAHQILLNKMEEYGVDEEIIEEFASKSKGYVPHKWYGDWVVAVKDKKGRTIFMSGVNYTERFREVERLEELFPEHRVLDPIKRKKIPYEAFQEAPIYAVQAMVDKASEKAGITPDSKKAMEEALRDLYKSKGFGMHFIKRKGVPGYTEELTRPLAEYFVGFSGYITKMEAIQAFPMAMSGIDMERTPNLYEYTLDYINYVTGDPYDFHTIKSIAYFYYLFGNIKSASLNLTQNMVLGWPVLSKHTKWSLAKMGQAMERTASGLLTKGEKQFLANLEAGGHLEAKLSQEIAGYAGNPLFRKFQGADKRLFSILDAFGHAERFNRRSMAVAIYDSGIRDINKAAELISLAHFRYSKGNRPYVSMQFKGLFSPAMVFRSWYINYVQFIKNQLKAGEIGVLGRSIAALMLFGGLAAFPFWDQFKGLWTKYFGTDPETEIREVLGKRLGRDLVHGLPSEIGVEFSGSVGMGDILPTNIEDVLGVFADVPKRVAKVSRSLGSKDYIRAMEDASPEFLRNPMAAYRLYKKGATSRSGRPILDLRTGDQLQLEKGEAYKKMFGYYPIRLAEQYGIGETIKTVQMDRLELKRTWADRYRIAYLAGNNEEMRKVVTEIKAHNQKMNDQGRPEDRISPREMKAMLRARWKAINKPPKYMRPKLRKLTEHY